MRSFVLSRIPKTFFGNGTLKNVPGILKEINCRKLLLVTGGKSFIASPQYDHLKEALSSAGIEIVNARVVGEPSPQTVDQITDHARSADVDTVLAIGGGSVLDAGKAVSAMVKVSGSVKDYLEGVGTKVHDGTKIPMIAVPTTSGTGSEATKNAVLSNVGENGFKKSLRHDNFVPEYAVLDPELTVNLPVSVTAASGMDALNQLIEGYLSVKANPYTDALALLGIQKIDAALEYLCTKDPSDLALRGEMAYGAYLSGIVLANAGLGYVHGFAGSIGGLADIPHGVVCGKLNAVIFEAVAKKIAENKESCTESYYKLLALADLLVEGAATEEMKITGLVDRLYSLEQSLNLPLLSAYGIGDELVRKAISGTSGKECPVKLAFEELHQCILSKL